VDPATDPELNQAAYMVATSVFKPVG